MTNNEITIMTERISHGHVYIENKGIGFFKSPSITETSFADHGFTARIGGVSPAPYDSLNLSLSRPDSMDNVAQNYRRMADAAGFDVGSIVIVNYEHGNNVLRVSTEDTGAGLLRDKRLPACDALITNDPNATLLTLHADCGAWFFADVKNRAIGLAHAGWRGTLTRIASNVVKKMGEEFGTKPIDIIAAGGPCICGGCYQVDEGLAEKFISEFHTSKVVQWASDGQPLLDISLCVLLQLIEAGLPPENMSVFDACTYEMSDSFFSYRRDMGKTGAMAAFIRLK